MATTLTFAFINSNTPTAVTARLQQVLLEKLLAEHPQADDNISLGRQT